MAGVKFSEFLQFLKRRDVFSYNLRSVALSLEDIETPFDGALVLDAGAGARLKHFKDSISRARCLVGIDFSDADLRANRNVGAKVLGDVERLPFRGRVFDCVIAVEVVEHLAHPAGFFAEAARCLKPGGTMIVCTPNLWGYKALIAWALPRPLLDLTWRVFKGRLDQPHPTYYRANSLPKLRRLAATAGLTVERSTFLNEISHFFYPSRFLCLLVYLYGRLLEFLHLEFLLNGVVCVLRKDVTIPARSLDRVATA